VNTPQPTDAGRPKELAVARAINFAMTTLLTVAVAGFSAWATYREIVLIEAHGEKLSEHLQDVFEAASLLILCVGFWIGWWREARARRIRNRPAPC
jgi:hypothetical protein